MNIASLELCKELYELSHWTLTEKHWYQGKAIYNAPWGWDCSAYDLGFLLRKFVGNGGVTLHYGDILCYATSQVWTAQASTPEDAVALLCCRLIRQGILKREQA